MRSKKSSLIICSNVMQAKKVIQDLKFYSEIEIIYFPVRILNYYETEAESKEIENQRMYAQDKPGVIAIDSLYSPVERVNYEVESARVGQNENFDKLIIK